MIEEAMSSSMFFCLGEDSWSTLRDFIFVFLSHYFILVCEFWFFWHMLCVNEILTANDSIKDVFIFLDIMLCKLYISGYTSQVVEQWWVRRKGKRPFLWAKPTLRFILLMSTFFSLKKIMISHKRSFVFSASINDLLIIP